jgi:ABC-type molybdenum transport system ATPase subunit/photorepair protein PhrA
VLEGLYQPLKDALSGSNETAKKLMFVSRTNLDVMGHAARGMELFDRRKSTFKDASELEAVLVEFFDTIQQANFARDTVKAAIQKLRGQIVTSSNPIREQLRKDHTAKDFADWLFSIDAYSVSYGIKFDNKDLKYLSPGEKGIVLLLLYLEAEEEDNRPLIVDQPDDNLDNLSIYPNLIEYFRDRKRTRQIVIITHNPNLVVTTDSEQVIVGAFDGTRAPKIRYRGGALENTGENPLGIREEVCRILEGGTEAFKVRENRYAIDHG